MKTNLNPGRPKRPTSLQRPVNWKTFKKIIFILLTLCFSGYRTNAQDWVQLGTDIDGEAASDLSGTSVSISADGNTMAVGAPENDGGGSNAGHVRVYSWDGSNWTQQGADIEGSDSFGRSISLSGDGSTVAIGATSSSNNTGHTSVYTWSGSAWVQLGANILGDVEGDRFGCSVSLSEDGSRLAVGGRHNETNGFRSGHVRVFDWSGTAWVQQGSDLVGDQAYGSFGTVVDLNSGGDTLVVGAPFHTNTESSQGAAKIYAWSGSSWAQVGSSIYGEAGGINLARLSN